MLAAGASSSTSCFASGGRSASVVAVLGPTATGKSALGARDRRAVRRRDRQLRFDGGVPRLRHRHRQGAARRAARHSASPDRHRRSDRGVHGGAVTRATRRRRSATFDARQRLPIVVGGTGFYYRALTRGLFPGPGRDAALRARLERDRRAPRTPSGCTGCSRASIRRRRGASSRATRSAWCARSRCTS